MLSVASCSTGSNRPRPIQKRKNDSDSETTGIKIPRGGFYVVLESESEVSSSEEDTESILSLQNKSTDIAKDTSDTCSKSSFSHRGSDWESIAGVEYDVVSLSEHEPPFDFSDTYSDSDEIMAPMIKAVCCYQELWKDSVCVVESGAEDDGGLWADGSSGVCEQDTATSDIRSFPLRLRSCVKCKAQTNQFQYCHQCYKVRKDFFPPRPKIFKKKSSKPSNKKKTSIKESPKTDPWVGQSSSSQEFSLTPSGVLSPHEGESLCNVCLKNPKNGAFLHNRWIHIYSCYQCSLKTWYSTKCCPLCNGKISKVLKVAVG